MIDSIIARRVLTATGWTGPARLTIDAGQIVAIEPTTIPADVDLLTAGFVDVQVNGIDDVDVSSAAGADWQRLADALLDQGVTAWCPTLVSMPLTAYAAPLERIGAARPMPGAAHIIGAHLEGPFLGGAPGAHRADLLIDPDLDWIAALPDHVRMVTLSPERPGADEATRLLTSRGVTVAIGHTRATVAQLDGCVAAGASLVTHLFNAMTGMDHRTPGVAAWALRHPTIAASLIADLVHVDAAIIDLAMRLLGPRRAVLVTDSVGWRAGRAGPIGLSLRDGAPRLADGTLAGSALRMDAAVRNAIGAGVDPATALWAASRNPARLVGVGHEHGVIAVGRRADLVALDDRYELEQVWLSGTAVAR